MIKLYCDDVCEYINENKTDLINDLRDDGLSISDERLEAYAYDIIDVIYHDFISDVKTYDNNKKYDNILVVASLGLWYGRKNAQKTFKDLYSALSLCFEDINTVFYKDKRQTLTLEASHHDGNNIFKFYKVINGKKYAIKYSELYRG